jgi:hypothetical protein
MFFEVGVQAYMGGGGGTGIGPSVKDECGESDGDVKVKVRNSFFDKRIGSRY